MSLYRQPGRAAGRAVVVAAVAALLVGGAIGYALGSSGNEEEVSLSEAVAALRADLAPVRNGLDFVPTEYREGVRGGRVVSQAEYEAARAAVRRSRATLAARYADLRALDPDGAKALEGALTEVESAIVAREEPRAVERLVGRARAQLAALAG